MKDVTIGKRTGTSGGAIRNKRFFQRRADRGLLLRHMQIIENLSFYFRESVFGGLPPSPVS